jgi:hypothetical protein
MTAMTAMAEMATEMAMATAAATAMMPLPPPLATLSMKTAAALQGRRLDDGNWMTMMGG